MVWPFQDEVFILKPKVYEPTGPPRPVNDVKVAPGSKTIPYEELRGSLPPQHDTRMLTTELTHVLLAYGMYHGLILPGCIW